MFERYTERARRVIFFAHYEASQFGSTAIETEHLLLALICAPEKRPRAPVDAILTPGIGYSITPFPQFLDRLAMENRVHFSYASTDNHVNREWSPGPA